MQLAKPWLAISLTAMQLTTASTAVVASSGFDHQAIHPTRESEIEAAKYLTAGNLEAALPLMHETLVASGFYPTTREALAYVYELRGDYLRALESRLGPELRDLPEPPELPTPGDGLRGRQFSLNLVLAQEYFQRRGSDTDPVVGVLFGFLSRKFDLQWSEPILSGYLAKTRTDAYLALLKRIAEPAHTAHFELQELGPMDRDVIAALYCDQSPLPLGYFAQLYWSSLQGGYHLTHSMIALEIAVGLGCIEHVGQWKKLQDLQLALMLGEASRANTIDDLFVEIVAFLLVAKAASPVPVSWIEKIAAVQNADGGWGEYPGQPSNDHTSVLALMVLLEAHNDNTAWIPIVQHPRLAEGHQD